MVVEDKGLLIFKRKTPNVKTHKSLIVLFLLRKAYCIYFLKKKITPLIFKKHILFFKKHHFVKLLLVIDD